MSGWNVKILTITPGSQTRREIHVEPDLVEGPIFKDFPDAHIHINSDSISLGLSNPVRSGPYALHDGINDQVFVPGEARKVESETPVLFLKNKETISMLIFEKS